MMGNRQLQPRDLSINFHEDAEHAFSNL